MISDCRGKAYKGHKVKKENITVRTPTNSQTNDKHDYHKNIEIVLRVRRGKLQKANDWGKQWKVIGINEQFSGIVYKQGCVYSE